MALVLVDTLIDKCPSWGYLLLLLVASAGSIFLAGVGMRVASRLLSRMRRLSSFAG
jgi:hypothetical protein